MKITTVLAVLATGLSSSASTPVIASPPEVSLPNTEVRALSSEIVDQEFSLMISRPFRPPNPPATTYPVLYLLDADMSFPLVRQVALSLQSGFELPPVLIVGIGYAGGIREAMQRRNRDYTPTPDPVFMKYNERWGGGPAVEGGPGGAAKFLRFVREELKPFVEANYLANPEDATIFGVSFGGLFATYTLLERPDTFQRYIIGSPSLWWNQRVVFDYEERYAEAHEDLAARVFVAAGGHETAEHDAAQLSRLPEEMRRTMLEFQKAVEGSAQMVEVIEPFVDRLRGRGYPSLDLTLHIFPGESHGSVPPMTISRGLRTVFGTL